MSETKLLPGMLPALETFRAAGCGAIVNGPACAALDRDRAQWAAEVERLREENTLLTDGLGDCQSDRRVEVERLRAALARIVDLRAPYKRDPQERAEAAVREAQKIAQDALDGVGALQ